jgi:hypothetical protein
VSSGSSASSAESASLSLTDKGDLFHAEIHRAFFLLLSGVFAQKHPLQELIAARARRFAGLEEPAGARVAELRGRATESSCGRQDFREEAGVQVDTVYVRTYYVYMNVTLSVDDEVLLRARQQADALGTSVNQLIRDYLEQLAGRTDSAGDAVEFERLSRLTKGDSRAWKFSRDELHERR